MEHCPAREQVDGSRVPWRSFLGPGGPGHVQGGRLGRITRDNRLGVVYSSESPMAQFPYPCTRSKGAWDAILLDLNLRWDGRWANRG
jgi:hypothetical protein